MIYNAEENQKLSLTPLLKGKKKREYIFVFRFFAEIYKELTSKELEIKRIIVDAEAGLKSFDEIKTKICGFP